MPITIPEDIPNCLGWGVVSETGHVTLDGAGRVDDFGKAGMTIRWKQASASDAPYTGATVGTEDAIEFIAGNGWMSHPGYTPVDSTWTMGAMIQFTALGSGMFGNVNMNSSRSAFFDGDVVIEQGSYVSPPRAFIGNSALSNVHAIVCGWTGSATPSWIDLDGVQAASGTLGTGTIVPDVMSLATPNVKGNFKWSRVAVYNRVLDVTERTDLADWLAAGQVAATVSAPLRRIGFDHLLRR